MERIISREFAALREEVRAYSEQRAKARALAQGDSGCPGQGARLSQQPGGAAEWLTTWGEIAWHLGVSEDTAQRLARREEDPLPVQRLGGRVTMRRSIADEWREAQPLYRAGKGKRGRPE